MNEILGYDSTNSYATMSIASLGPSTLTSSENKPKNLFISKSSELFSSSPSAAHPQTTSSSHSLRRSKQSLNDISDIDGAQPKQYRPRNYVSNCLKIDDIDGTKARAHDHFLKTNRHVNPLNPSYQLPVAEIAPYEPPKFQRDTLEIDDIPGTRSIQRKVICNRDGLQIDDIEGSRSGWKPRHMRARSDAPPHDSINMTLTKSKSDLFRDHTQRETDPLEPFYFINGNIYSKIEKNQPSQPKPFISDSKLLLTQDIEGAQAGYRLKHRSSIPEESRREYRNTNYLEDIEGAHADTVKHSIRTTRTINPLMPCYQSLDGNQEYLTGPIDSLVPPHLVDQRSDFKCHGTMRAAKGGEGFSSSRQNILSRSGNSSLLTSPSLNHHPTLPPLSPNSNSFLDTAESGFYSSTDFHGGGGGGGLSQSKSYAEKYFPKEMDLLATNDFHTNATADIHSPVKLQFGSLTRSQPSLTSPVDTSKNLSRSGFSSPITTNRSKASTASASLSSRRQKVEYDAEVDAVRRL